MSRVVVGVAMLGACAVAFLAGRAWPRPRTATSSAGAVAGAPSSDAVATTGSTAGQRGASVPNRAHDASTPVPALTPAVAPFVEAWREQPEAAEATRATVTRVLEARRRAADAEFRACAAPQTDALLRVRFSVEVDVTTHQLVVGDAGEAEVIEGPPLDAAALACMAEALAGRDEIAAAERQPFLTGYQGTVDYIAAVAYGP